MQEAHARTVTGTTPIEKLAAMTDCQDDTKRRLAEEFASVQELRGYIAMLEGSRELKLEKLRVNQNLPTGKAAMIMQLLERSGML